LVGIDRDVQALSVAEAALAAIDSSGRHYNLLHGDFAQSHTLLGGLAQSRTQLTGSSPGGETHQVSVAYDGILLDLGVNSMQIDCAGRGFSFRHDGPLDMRLDLGGGVTAAQLVATLSESELMRLISEYGEDRYARLIARAIIDERQREEIRTTAQLARIVRAAVPRSSDRIDPATRTFQALRMATNDELGALAKALAALPDYLADGGVLAIISFHSLEDRAVKQAFAALQSTGQFQVLTRKPQTASLSELAVNRRARSAKLRALRRSGGLA
jgi:16S rRNA (cytosine1402-N4)-methyltransferase